MKKSLVTICIVLLNYNCIAQSVDDFNFIPNFTDNNMSVVFPAGMLTDFDGGIIGAFSPDGFPVSMTGCDEYYCGGGLQDDGSAGVAVVGTDFVCECDYIYNGDEIKFAILMNGESIVHVDVDPPLSYMANSFEMISGDLSFSIDGVPLVLGCTDPNYLEFNPEANLDDNSCNTIVVCGCTDPSAFNYDPIANVNQVALDDFDNPCIPFEFGCTEFHAFNFNPDANVNDGSCQMPYFESFDFFPMAADNNMSAVFSEGVLSDFEGGLLQAYIDGNPVSQSSQIQYDGAGGVAVVGTDALCQCDYAQSGDEITFSILVGGHTVVDIETDPPLAYQANSFSLNWWNSINFTIDGNPVIEGCTNSSYVEFNPNANLYDGSCLTRAIYGCNDVLACNYINADINDGSCVYPGCTDNNFIEYYNQGFVAGCDNGSCGNLVKDLGLEVSHFQDPMITGTSMNLGFNLSNIQGIENATIAAFYDLNGDGIINTDVYTANNGLNFSECVGLTDFSNDFFTLALWGDDSSTDVVDGLQSGQSEVVFALLTQDNQVIAFNLDPEFPSFNANGLYVVNNIDFNVVLYGCMDSNDCKYNPEAEEDDGSCIGAPDCKDPLYFEYNENAGCNDQEMCSNTWQDLYYTALDSASLAFAIDEAQDQELLAFTLDSASLAFAIDEAQDQDILDSTQAELEYWSSPIVVDLNIGWNMIGYTFKEPQDVVASMSEVYDIIDIVKDNQAEVYWPEFGFNGIGDLIPGQGYQVKVEEAYEGFYFADVDGQRFDLVPTVPQWAINMQVESHPNDIRTLVRVVNMLGQEVNPETEPKGIVLLYLYNDATVEKRMTK